MVDDVLDNLLPDGNLRVVFVLLLPKVRQSAKLTNFQCERSSIKHMMAIGTVCLVASGVCELDDSSEFLNR